MTENCTYIVNPSYPSNYAPSSTPTSLSYTVSKCSTGAASKDLLIYWNVADVCRVRLDYDLFVLTAPLTAAATQGQCSTDVMTLTTTAQTVAATTTTYGMSSSPAVWP